MGTHGEGGGLGEKKTLHGLYESVRIDTFFIFPVLVNVMHMIN